MRYVQVMPLDEEEGLPLPQIYGSVLVQEDITALKKTRRPDEPTGNKTLDSITEMFYVKNEFARRIFLKGEAGHGKTVFCLKLIDTWSKGKQTAVYACSKHSRKSGSLKSRIVTWFNSRKNFGKAQEQKRCKYEELSHEDEKLQSCLSSFDMVFYVPLRHAKQEVSCVVDLVCDSLSGCDVRSKQNIKKMLREGSIQCLVILDGLDEWRAPDTCRFKGFPDSDDLVNCTLLCTMRPWRMVTLQFRLDASFDKVVQILGLKNESIETVINNVLVNFYGLEISSDLYKEKFKSFCKKARLPEMESLMKIPLILTASCLVWNEEDDASDGSEKDHATPYFITFFYLKLKEINISRAENKHDTVKSFLFEKRQKPERSLNVPNILLGFEPIIAFIEILKPVGRLALQDLLSEEPNLVFPRNKLEREIGQSNVDLALKAGILSKTKAPGLSNQQRVKLSFYHKSIQEFIAALYMTCGGTEALQSFLTHCNSVEKVMELSNMIMFVFGLDPVVGSQLSEHVKDIVNCNTDILEYREGYLLDRLYGIVQIYSIQCKWFHEMKHNTSYNHNRDCTPTLHVTDVCLTNWNHNYNNTSVEDVTVASELVSMEDNSIVSLNLSHHVHHPVQSIIKHLPGCKHLTVLIIEHNVDTQDAEVLVEVLPQLMQLQYVQYGMGMDHKPSQADTAVVQAAQFSALTYLILDGITSD